MKPTPKWAQPFFSERECSICGSKEIYHERSENWEEQVDIPEGPIISVVSFAMKCWCRDCFEDCGGST